MRRGLFERRRVARSTMVISRRPIAPMATITALTRRSRTRVTADRCAAYRGTDISPQRGPGYSRLNAQLLVEPGGPIGGGLAGGGFGAGRQISQGGGVVRTWAPIRELQHKPNRAAVAHNAGDAAAEGRGDQPHRIGRVRAGR